MNQLAARFLIVGVLTAVASRCPAAQLLVVVEETGQQRSGLPVVRPHPQPHAFLGELQRGFSGRLLRLYRYEQNYFHKLGGPPPEPAYLLLSGRQGGFPKRGLCLGEQTKPQAGYVDLHRGKRLSGMFGAMDQIFPHELAHLLMLQAIGPPKRGGTNQMHAVGVRTDPVEAFHEGFAEHCQVMAIEDADADPRTRALAHDAFSRQHTAGNLRLYSKELTTHFPLAVRWRMTFPLWFSQTDQMLRYIGVRANAFAREPALPAELLGTPDAYAAYLLANVLPGEPQGRPKSAARMLATEGVVSALFYRWAQSAPLRGSYREAAFYARFDADRARISPLENVYLKLIHAMAAGKPRTTAELVVAYKNSFPDEAAAADAVVSEALLGQPLPDYPEIWLGNREFRTGSSLFDQFRAQPRMHTFDLNAASLVDLLGVPGVGQALGESMLRSGPYTGLEDLRRVPGMTPALLDRFRAMSADMSRFLAGTGEDQAGISPAAILWSYAWRMLLCILGAASSGAALFRWVRPVRTVPAVAAGTGAALLGLAGGWLTGGNALTALLIPSLFLGMPAVLWTLWRRRDFARTTQVALAWVAAAVPAALLAWPW